jgi:LuxR family maltose regulon positive regulatory protein
MPRLQPNINAMRTWVALLKNDIDAVQKWVEQEPNENTDFYILDRYRYLIKLRCYIALEEYEKAWNLSSKLDTYFTEYDRGYMWVENTLLRAVIAYRQNKPMWRELFSTALEKAKERQLVWVIAQEGIALKPLFEEFECDSEDEYLRRVLAKQKDMTCYYPRYLCRNFSLEEPLTNMERKILSLHAEGIPTDEILEILCITQRTLKFHNSNIYRKLGAKKYKIV